MTRIQYEDRMGYQLLRISGHAGDRIVCAGISAISQTLIANLEREEKENQIRLEWEMTEPGEMTVRAWTNDRNRDEIRAMFRFTMEGLEHIRKDYPGNIEMIGEGETHGGI